MWSNPGKGVAPSPTPRCSSYLKGSLLVALDYGLTYIYIYFTMINKYGLFIAIIKFRTTKKIFKYIRTLILPEKLYYYMKIDM